MDKQEEFLRAKKVVSKVSRGGAGQMKTDWKTRVECVVKEGRVGRGAVLRRRKVGS